MRNTEKTNNVETLHCNISTKRKSAFTLVELIIVITILAILATIGFMSFQTYTIDARDANRITSLKTMSDWLQIYQAKKSILPDPDAETVNIYSGWLLISTQWYAWTSVLQKLRASDIKDPSDKSYYTYIVNSDKTKYQLLWMLEKDTNLVAYSPLQKGEGLGVRFLNEANARTDYTSRYAYTTWNKVGIFFSWTTNIPLQETISGSLVLTDATNSNKVFKVMFSNLPKTSSGYVESTGAILPAQIQTITNSVATSVSTDTTNPTCPTGFIYIPGSANIDWQAKWWCVAKYEMTPSSTTWWTQDTTYGWWKYTADTSTALNASPWTITSKSGAYPITYISRNEAQSTCSTALKDSLWNTISNGKLLTANLWWMVARDIEQQSINWSGNAVWNWYMSRWHANYGKNSAGTNDSFSWYTTCYWAAWTRYVCQGMSDISTNPTDYYSNRAYKLSSWDIIHDFAWNLWEWYYDTHDSGWNVTWTYYSNDNITRTVLSSIITTPSTNYGLNIAEARTTWRWLGWTYNAGAIAWTTYASIFGGSFANTTNAGVFTSHWSTYSPSSNRGYSIGFRCIAPAN